MKKIQPIPKNLREKRSNILKHLFKNLFMIHLFDIIDKTGRKIRLPHIRWKHILREHPNLQDHEEILQALIHPLIIQPSDADPIYVHHYYSYTKLRRKYLMVAVKYLNGEGFVITAYYTKKIQ